MKGSVTTAACLTTLLPNTIFSRLLLSVMVMDAAEIVCIMSSRQGERELMGKQK